MKRYAIFNAVFNLRFSLKYHLGACVPLQWQVFGFQNCVAPRRIFWGARLLSPESGRLCGDLLALAHPQHLPPSCSPQLSTNIRKQITKQTSLPPDHVNSKINSCEATVLISCKPSSVFLCFLTTAGLPCSSDSYLSSNPCSSINIQVIFVFCMQVLLGCSGEKEMAQKIVCVFRRFKILISQKG